MRWKERGMVFMKMINKDYFKYLIKQHKRLIFLICLIGFTAIPFLSYILHDDTYYPLSTISSIALLYGFGLSFLVPIYLFSFLQKKKSTILYFSLPIKKEILFTTTTVFSLFVTIVPIVVCYILAIIPDIGQFYLTIGNYILSVLIIIIYMFCQQAVVITVTLLCQNTLDSFVANVAYAITPLLAFGSFYIFISNRSDYIMLGQGNYAQKFFELVHYISIPYNGIFEITNSLVSYSYANKYIIIYWLIIGIVLMICAYKLFNRRSMEESENRTKSVLIYPVLITAIIFSMMLITYEIDFGTSTIISYTFIIIIYLLMYFFSVRKIYFTWKIPAVFIVMIICCIGFTNIFCNTQGLGMLSEYPDIQNISKFSIEANSTKNLLYHEKDINYLKIDSENENTVKLILQFQKDLIENEVITPANKNISGYKIYLDFYYYDNISNYDDVWRCYVIVSTKNMNKFLEMYDELLKTIETNKEYTCHHIENFDEE